MKTKNFLISIFTALIIAVGGCSPKKYFTKDDTLLTSVKIECDDKTIDVAEPENYLRQKPVRTILGVALHARLYNSVNPQKNEIRKAKLQKELDEKNNLRSAKFEAKVGDLNYAVRKHTVLGKRKISQGDTAKAERHFKKAYKKKTKLNELTKKGYKEKTKIFSFPVFLQKIGEEPVIYKESATLKSLEQIKQYMKNEGFYESEVTFTEKITRRNVKLTYNIHAGQPVKIARVYYSIDEDTLRENVFADSSACLLKAGKNLELELFQNERDRIANCLKNRGYYYFTKDYITYQVDTLSKGYNANITIEISPVILDNGRVIQHRKFYVSQVKVFPNHDSQAALTNREEYFTNLDTLYYMPADTSQGGIYFLRKNGQVVKPWVVNNEIFVRPRTMYSLKAQNDTYKHLSAFNVYKVINVEYEPASSRDSINCNIYLSNNQLQAYILELESTNSSGNLGAGASFTYKHNNIFRGAETFDMKFTTAFESQNNLTEEQMRMHLNTQEYGLELRLYFPRLLSLGLFKKYIRDLNPKTYFTLGSYYRQRPDYTRTNITASVYYQWQTGNYFTHTFTPVRLSTIRVSDADSAFMAWLEQLYIKDSYEDHFIFGSSYSLGFNNQTSGKRNYYYLKATLSTAGNLLNLLSKKFATPTPDGSYEIPYLNIRYAQFVKTELDFRHYVKANSLTTLVTRFYFGIGVPYGNNRLLPFTEQFFSGGANSIRAWQIRSVGPGESNSSLMQRYPNQTADMKLEGNFECRFKIAWVLEGSWFVDAGNIWSISKDDRREGGAFDFKSFYKQLAVGSGLGLRLDFDFFIFRLDFGLKLHDPAMPEGSRWIVKDDKLFMFRGHNWAFNLGIGYPF